MERYLNVAAVLIFLLVQPGVAQTNGADCLYVKAELEKFMSSYSVQLRTLLDYLADSLNNSANNCTCDCGANNPDATSTLATTTEEKVRNTEIICEGNSRTIQCASGVLNIMYANYGRTNSELCPHRSIHTTSCSAASSESRVTSQCHGKKHCSLAASNGVFGDPCRGTYKYLEITYTCVVDDGL